MALAMCALLADCGDTNEASSKANGGSDSAAVGNVADDGADDNSDSTSDEYHDEQTPVCYRNQIIYIPPSINHHRNQQFFNRFTTILKNAQKIRLILLSAYRMRSPSPIGEQSGEFT